MKKQLIGHVTVDTAQIIITDPAYLDNWNRLEGFNYGTAEMIHPFSEMPINHATAIVSSTNGDGNFPVYAIIDNKGVIQKIIIDFYE